MDSISGLLTVDSISRVNRFNTVSTNHLTEAVVNRSMESMATTSSSDRPPMHIQYVWENERRQPLTFAASSWGSSYPGHLLPTDPSRWSNDDGSIHAMRFNTNGFILDVSTPGCDKDGWVYAFNFGWFEGGRFYKKANKPG